MDSSDDERNQEAIEQASAGPLGDRVDWMRTEPGLPRQRNLGVASISEGIVHFIDDDSIVEPRYFDAIMRVFSTDPHGLVGGVGGVITNLPPHAPGRLLRAFQLDSASHGVVLPSGRNVLVFSASSPLDVDWLSGSSMSYRREVFDEFRFDESLAGWALGEDVDFSYRVRQRYRLVVTPDARTEHRQSDLERWQRDRVIRTELLHRYVRVRSGVGKYSTAAFWWSALGQVVWHSWITLTRHPRDGSKQLRATLRGIVAVASAAVRGLPR